MPTDYYKILEVSQFASKYEIKKSYRRLAFKYHPDRNSGNKTAESRFKEISEAYRILSDEISRHKYDSNYSGYSDDYKKNQQGTYKKEEVRTPNEVFNIISDFRKQVVRIGRRKINHFALFNRLE
jgi:DnaJ-class molecular chaperone